MTQAVLENAILEQLQSKHRVAFSVLAFLLLGSEWTKHEPWQFLKEKNIFCMANQRGSLVVRREPSTNHENEPNHVCGNIA